jgi:hypothetical protein
MHWSLTFFAADKKQLLNNSVFSISAKGYEKSEPALIEKLLKLRSRLVEADLGHGIKTKYWDK